MAAFETALAKAPQRESTLDFAAELAEKMDRPADAIAYLRQLCRGESLHVGIPLQVVANSWPNGVNGRVPWTDATRHCG